MLTNKQRWRHQSVVGIKRQEHDFLYSQGIDNLTSRVFPKSYSESSLGDVNRQVSRFTAKVHATTGSFIDTKNVVLTREKVRFNPAIRVVLIPTVSEYRQAGLGQVMWWDESDYNEFKLSAITELKVYMLKHRHLDTKGAIKELYQMSPDDDEDKRNGVNSRDNSGKYLSGRISSAILADMDCLLVKSRAKSIQFNSAQSIFDHGPTESSETGKVPPSLDNNKLPLNPLGMIMMS